MPFNQQPINYAAEYARELANAYPYLSYFGEVWASPNSNLYRPGRGKTVYVPSMTVSGATAVNRDQITGVFNRNFNNEYQALTMSMDREWSTLIDPMDIVQTDEVVTIANVTRTFNSFEKVPEMDAYLASKCAGLASQFGGIDSTVLTGANILAQWDSWLEYMTSQRINRDRLRAYFTPAAYKLLKEAAGITRFLDAGTGIRDVDRNVGRLDGVYIKEVPPDMMKSLYDFTTGWTVANGAQQINALLIDPLAIVAPVIYETSMVTAPNAATKGKWLYYERYYYDVFGLNNRLAGFFANMSAPSLGELTVTSVAGSATGATVVTVAGNTITASGSPNYGSTLYYSANAAAVSLAYGSALPGSATWAAMTANPATIASQSGGNYITIAQVNNQSGNVIAGGNAVEVVGS